MEDRIRERGTASSEAAPMSDVYAKAILPAAVLIVGGVLFLNFDPANAPRQIDGGNKYTRVYQMLVLAFGRFGILAFFGFGAACFSVPLLLAIGERRSGLRTRLHDWFAAASPAERVGVVCGLLAAFALAVGGATAAVLTRLPDAAKGRPAVAGGLPARDFGPTQEAAPAAVPDPQAKRAAEPEPEPVPTADYDPDRVRFLQRPGIAFAYSTRAGRLAVLEEGGTLAVYDVDGGQGGEPVRGPTMPEATQVLPYVAGLRDPLSRDLRVGQSALFVVGGPDLPEAVVHDAKGGKELFRVPRSRTTIAQLAAADGPPPPQRLSGDRPVRIASAGRVSGLLIGYDRSGSAPQVVYLTYGGREVRRVNLPEDWLPGGENLPPVLEGTMARQFYACSRDRVLLLNGFSRQQLRSLGS